MPGNLNELIAAFLKRDTCEGRWHSLSGGCVDETGYWQFRDGRRIFIKLGRKGQAKRFAAEARGLQLLAEAKGPRVPEVLGQLVKGDQACLILEYLDLQPLQNPVELGYSLAQLHIKSGNSFGWPEDNWIGSSPQKNRWRTDWVDFWREERLGYQLQLARENGAPGQLLAAVEELQQGLDAFFTQYQPRPSLVHGDLWSGNWASDPQGRSVIYDPAAYYGDREVDLAMTELFGGPGPDFYAAYQEVWPLDPGYSVRKQLYNLYHLLNHFNMFGSGYVGQAKGTALSLLAEIR
ncbi:fructosamine kinase family protein [Marinospirillum perlucidum]|uniref:fructosamine kinase family protein n=1 Tax=Marinospirillum perlucidum TaxID=1982602 RepID=UPI000DF25E08|nr:fructosamine kinase family protein [Marinospirillum perlucidum]